MILNSRLDSKRLKLSWKITVINNTIKEGSLKYGFINILLSSSWPSDAMPLRDGNSKKIIESSATDAILSR